MFRRVQPGHYVIHARSSQMAAAAGVPAPAHPPPDRRSPPTLDRPGPGGVGFPLPRRCGAVRRAVLPVKVLMVAPPGAGKGTQAVVIAEHFDVPHIATGDLLRQHVARGTELGRAVQSFLDRGELVSARDVPLMVAALTACLELG